MPGKDIEDELGTVNHARMDDLLYVPLLRRRKIMIEQDEISR